MRFLEDRIRVAKVLFGFDAVSGALSVAGAALYGAALGSGNAWLTFLGILVPFALLWSLICWCAYRGLTTGGIGFQVVFWLFVAGHLFAFPVGTAIAGLCLWLWRELHPRATPVPA